MVFECWKCLSKEITTTTLSDSSDDEDTKICGSAANVIAKLGLRVKEEHLELEKANDKEKVVLKRFIGLSLDDMVVGKFKVNDKESGKKDVEISCVILFNTTPVMDLERTPKYAVQALAKAFGVKNFNNLGKARISQKIATKKSVLAKCKSVDDLDETTITNTKYEVFLFINVVFSEQFLPRFRLLGKQPDRMELDKGKNNGFVVSFWQDVGSTMVAAVGPNGEGYKEYLVLEKDPSGYLDKANINLLKSVVSSREAKEMQKMYTKLRSDWTIANKNYHQSGTHDHNFWHFCKGDLRVYYFDLVLSRLGKDIINTVSTDLPTNALISSAQSNKVDPSFLTPSPKRHGKGLSNELAAHSQVVKSIGSERNLILRRACDDGVNKRRKLLDIVMLVNNNMIATGKQIDDTTKDLVPMVPRKDNESWEEKHQWDHVERRHKLLRQLQGTMDILSTSFEKASADLEELDAAESEEAIVEMG